LYYEAELRDDSEDVEDDEATDPVIWGDPASTHRILRSVSSSAGFQIHFLASIGMFVLLLECWIVILVLSKWKGL